MPIETSGVAFEPEKTEIDKQSGSDNKKIENYKFEEGIITSAELAKYLDRAKSCEPSLKETNRLAYNLWVSFGLRYEDLPLIEKVELKGYLRRFQEEELEQTASVYEVEGNVKAIMSDPVWEALYQWLEDNGIPFHWARTQVMDAVVDLTEQKIVTFVSCRRGAFIYKHLKKIIQQKHDYKIFEGVTTDGLNQALLEARRDRYHGVLDEASSS